MAFFLTCQSDLIKIQCEPWASNQTYTNIDQEVIIEGENEKATKICELYRKKNNFKYKVNKKPIGLQN